MIKYTRLFITVILATIVYQVSAQSTATTSSPYSQFGLGELVPQALTQNIGMGELTTATNQFGGYLNINPANPASYGAIGLTTVDIGLYGQRLILSQNGQPNQSNGNFRLSHVAFAFPITRRSALSFGMLPYSQMGYNYKQTRNNFGTGLPTDTNQVNYLYNGDGGLTKAYIGYGFGIGRHFLIGGNVSYIFGKLHQYAATEIPNLPGTLDSKIENTYAIGGVNYDYGAQYTIDLNTTNHIILGYSGSSSNDINSQYSNLVYQYNYDSNGNQNTPLDTLSNTKNPKNKIKLPLMNHFGLTYMQDNKFLIGGQYSTGKWSQLTIGGVNQGLQDSKTFNIGGQITPKWDALNNYWATVSYQLGFIYNQTYVNVNDPPNNNTTNIKNYAITFGMGLPLHPSPTGLSFYRINFAAEVGREGTLQNNLVRETYVNFHLSFTLNDRWFMQYKLGE
jgi:hypothetical protein